MASYSPALGPKSASQKYKAIFLQKQSQLWLWERDEQVHKQHRERMLSEYA